MVTIKIYDGWEFRMRQDGVVESRNQKAKLDWQERRAEDVGMLADQLYVIGLSIRQIASVYPARGQEIPTGAQVIVPQPMDSAKIM